jgi:putative transcription factor
MSKNNFNHQDLEPLVLRKSQTQLKKDNPHKHTTKVASNKPCNSNKLVSKKINDDGDFVPPAEKISHSLKIQIQQARTAKGWSQKELASQLGIQPGIVKDYENGKAVPNGALLAKMSQKMGVKFKK